jgi:hypothetical protein
VIDISDPTDPVLAGSYDTPDLARVVAIAGDHAYVADYGSGLQVVDISDPTNPVSAGSCDTPGSARGVAIAGDYAYVADSGSGLQVVEVFQRAVVSDANVARSLDVEPAGDEVIRARLNSTQTDSIRWELTADRGANWDEVLPGDGWHEFASVGSDLQWRSTHIYAGGPVARLALPMGRHRRGHRCPRRPGGLGTGVLHPLRVRLRRRGDADCGLLRVEEDRRLSGRACADRG